MEGGRRRSFGFMLTLPEGQCRIRLTAASCCPRRRERHEVQSRRRRLNWLLRCTPDRRSAARHMGGGVRARPRRPRAQPAVQGDSGPTSEISRPRAVVRRCRMRGPSVARTPVVRRTLICATGSPLKATPVGFVVVVLAAAAAATCCCGPRCRCRRRAAAEPQRLQHRVYLCTESLAEAMLPAWPGLPRVPGGQCIARRAAARASAVWSRWMQRTSRSWSSCCRRMLLPPCTR